MPRLTLKEYEQAKMLWAQGEHTLEQLSKKFDVTGNALYRRFQKDGVKKGQDVHRVKNALTEAMDERIADQAKEWAAVTIESKELHLKSANSLTRRAMYEIKKCIEEQKPLSAIQDILKSLNIAAKIVNLNYNSIEKILGLDKQDDSDEEKLTRFEIVPMTLDDVEAERQRQKLESGEDDDELTDLGDDTDELELVEEAK